MFAKLFRLLYSYASVVYRQFLSTSPYKKYHDLHNQVCNFVYIGQNYYLIPFLENSWRYRLAKSNSSKVSAEIARQLGEGVDNVIDDVTGRPQVATEGVGNVPSQVDNVNQPLRSEGKDLNVLMTN